jgi:CRP-like cAMP-binding protein
MEKILGLFDRFPHLSQDAKEAFVQKLVVSSFEKGDLLEKEGKVADHLHFIMDGAVRSFYFRDNKDITVSFALENEFVTAMHSFITRQPSYENIEALEKSKVASMHYADLQHLFSQFPDFERTYRMILEQYYIALEEHHIFSKFKSARDRYLILMDSRPKIIQKASVGHIASFLDMSIETLSRIRGKI